MFLLQINPTLSLLVLILITLFALQPIIKMWHDAKKDKALYAKRAELDRKWWEWYVLADGSPDRGAEKFLEWARYGALHFRNDDYFLPPQSVVLKLLYLSKYIPPELRKRHTNVVRLLRGKEQRYYYL